LALPLLFDLVLTTIRIFTIKTAFAYWEKRIAPVFDTARHIHVVTHESQQITKEIPETLPESPLVQKALKLVELGIQTLVCGAISKSLNGLVSAYGIRVVSYVAGDLRDVVQAWLNGNLDLDAFAMPGCREQGRRRFRGKEFYGNLEVSTMMPRGRGQGAGAGKGQGQGGTGLGRMGGSRKAGPVGSCVCPQCGSEAPHERGVPCSEQQCPKCGSFMTRQ
jgi:predicted Fe-Mo cluster-binding NifX family protein